MTTEQLKQNAAAMIAFADGKPIQVAYKDDASKWCEQPLPTWSFDAFQYRPTPMPVTRPWSKPNDVPLNCWIRFSGDDEVYYLITTIGNSGVRIYDSSLQSWDTIKTMEHSTDRKTWLPCTVVEQ